MILGSLGSVVRTIVTHKHTHCGRCALCSVLLAGHNALSSLPHGLGALERLAVLDVSAVASFLFFPFSFWGCWSAWGCWM